MSNTYTLLETITVGAAGTSSVIFNSIPQTGYTDLVVKSSIRMTTADPNNATIRFNGTTTGYSEKLLYGIGNAVASVSASVSSIQWGTVGNGTASTANTFSNCEFYVPNYTSANYKTVMTDSVQENNATAVNMYYDAGLWSNTAAITSITLTASAGLFLQYTTFSLYGVSALGVTPTRAPKATGGSIIQTDGTYWYHAFLATGEFKPATALTCDVLVVAGGGAGGMAAGGGGAGGVLAFASQSVGTSAQTVTVGGGGAGFTSYSNPVNGSNSQFGSLTASIGGGGGGGYNGTAYVSGGNGGSGGGSAWGTGNTYGTGTSGQGNNGGLGAQDSSGAPARNGGGGGGAGAVGGNGSIGTPPPGGAGVNTVTNWGSLSSVLTSTGLGVSGYIAGGGGSADAYGGGSSGGSGGAGAGATAGGSNAIANTGSGGGGGSNGSGSGSSGVVIIRYLA